MKLILKRMPRLITEPKVRLMSARVARGLAEKNVVKLVKAAAGQQTQAEL